MARSVEAERACVATHMSMDGPRRGVDSCPAWARVRDARRGDDAWMGARWMPWPAGPTKGAGTRRNASGSGSHAMIRGCPNGAIRHGQAVVHRPEHIGPRGGTGGTETS